MIYDSIVIGKGLIGSAAAKYLSQSQKKVALIGPDETLAMKEGIVFASHYDQSRIQRIIGKDATWTLLNKESADQYAALESETSIHFHTKVGCLYVNPNGNDAYIKNAVEQAARCEHDFQFLKNGKSLLSSFPEFSFPENSEGIFEASPSGYINPRLLVEAQLHIFKKNSGEIVNDIVNDISYGNGTIKISTHRGEIYQAKKVLLAPGAFINFLNLLQRKLSLKVKSETTIWVKVNEETVKRLENLPSLLYEIALPEIQNIYLVPPVQYPDGAYYLKMGANFPDDILFHRLKDIQDWFKGGNSNRNLETMQNALMNILPNISVNDSITKRCIVAFTIHGHPYIGFTDQQNVAIATGGNGYGAMCSDALGKIGSKLLLEGRFPGEYAPETFQPLFTD